MDQLPLEVYSSDEVKFIEAEHAKEHNLFFRLQNYYLLYKIL